MKRRPDIAEALGWDPDELDDDLHEWLVIRESPDEEWKDLGLGTFKRDDKHLVQHVLSADKSYLEVVEVPDEWNWAIFSDFIGQEWVIESGHCWPPLDSRTHDERSDAAVNEGHADSSRSMRVAINRTAGGRRVEGSPITFNPAVLMPEELRRIADLKGLLIARDSGGKSVDSEASHELPYACERHDPAFLEFAEETGRFVIIEIPAGTNYTILTDSDYCEWIVERGHIRGRIRTLSMET